jgi:hypothetical protein
MSTPRALPALVAAVVGAVRVADGEAARCPARHAMQSTAWEAVASGPSRTRGRARMMCLAGAVVVVVGVEGVARGVVGAVRGEEEVGGEVVRGRVRADGRVGGRRRSTSHTVTRIGSCSLSSARLV